MMVTRPTQKLDFLSKHELFQDLHPNEIKRLARKTTMFFVKRGRHFYCAGDKVEVLFILKEGMVHLYRLTPQGRQLIVATLTAGAVFGEMSLLSQTIVETFAQAATLTCICVMNRVDVMDLMQHKPLFALRLMEVYGKRLRRAERLLEQIAFDSVPNRLARKLLDLSADSQTMSGYTHQELADMIGTYRETVTTLLKDFRTQGIVETSRKQVRILDRSRLEALGVRATHF